MKHKIIGLEVRNTQVSNLIHIAYNSQIEQHHTNFFVWINHFIPSQTSMRHRQLRINLAHTITKLFTSNYMHWKTIYRPGIFLALGLSCFYISRPYKYIHEPKWSCNQQLLKIQADVLVLEELIPPHQT